MKLRVTALVLCGALAWPSGGMAQASLVGPSAGPRASDAMSPANSAAAAALAAQLPRLNLSARAIDSGLRDCHIPFDELATRAPSCLQDPPAEGRRCERASPSQFPEVVSIARIAPGQELPRRFCTGTLLSPSWVLTAAHCVLGNMSTKDKTGTPDADDTTFPTDRIVSSDYALALQPQDRIRAVKRQIAYRGYGGMGQAPGPYYANDIALIEVAAPFPREAIEQATLAPPGTFAAESTLAGFGASNFQGGTSGRFNITWPRPLTATDGRFTFAPDDRSAFCQGDSGGPVYAGRQRGCRPDDLAPEPRPRRIQAVISFDQPGTLVDPSTATDIELAQSCIFSPLMSMQSVTVPELRQWICTTTNDEAGGCP